MSSRVREVPFRNWTERSALRSWRRYQEDRIDGVELRVPFRDCAQYLTDLFLLRINFKSVSKTKPQMIFFINVTLTLLMWMCYTLIWMDDSGIFVEMKPDSRPWNQKLSFCSSEIISKSHFDVEYIIEIGEVTLFGDLEIYLSWKWCFIVLDTFNVPSAWQSYGKYDDDDDDDTALRENSVEDLQGCLWMVAWQLWWYKSPEQIWDAIFQTGKQQEAFPRTLSSKCVICI